VDYEFVTNCPRCGKEFTMFWVMNRVQVGPGTVAKITCPACARRFDQRAADLIPFKSKGVDLLTGRSVRTVELIYDCPSCGMREISVTLVHTNLSWEDLAKKNILTAACNSAICPQRGLRQRLKLGRARLGALNASWS
jgi:transcription elongation factor Elf1